MKSKRKSTIFFIIFLFLLNLSSCVKTEFGFPKAERFVITAIVSGNNGSKYDILITEQYSEFTSENLTKPVRYSNDGTLTTDGLTVKVDIKKESLFRLSEIFVALFDGNYTDEKITTKDNTYLFSAKANETDISCVISKENGFPTVFIINGNTINITNIELYQ